MRYFKVKDIIFFGVMMIQTLVAQDFSAGAIDAIDDVLRGGLEEFSIPSAVALVTNGERDIYLNSFGMLGSEVKSQ